MLAYLSLAVLPLNDDPSISDPVTGPWRGFPGNLLLDGWARWDAGWYQHIAKHGYVDAVVGPEGQRNLAFYPLYPLVIRIVDTIINNTLFSGILVSNLAFLGTVLLLYRMIRSRFGAEKARQSVLLLSVFPFSFYFSAVYSESLFFLLVVAAFYLAERDKWWAAAICAMLSGATRSPGLSLFPALGVLYLEKLHFDFRKIRPSILWLSLCVLGPVLFFLYLYVEFGDPWIQLGATRVPGWWEKGINLQGAAQTIGQLFSVERLLTGRFSVMFNLNLLMAGVFGLSLIPVFRRQPLSYGVLSLLLIGFGLAQWLGWGRYVLAAFPVYVAWSLMLKNKSLFEGVLVVSSLIQALLTILYSHWYWVS